MHHGPELVGERHQNGAARARLEILFRRRQALVPANAGERGGQSLDGGADRHAVVAHAERLGARRRVAQALIAGVGVGQHDAMHARPRRAHRRRSPRHSAESTPPDRPEHDAGEAILDDIVTQARDTGAIVGRFALLDRGDLSPDRNASVPSRDAIP